MMAALFIDQQLFRARSFSMGPSGFAYLAWYDFCTLKTGPLLQFILDACAFLPPIHLHSDFSQSRTNIFCSSFHQLSIGTTCSGGPNRST